MNIEDFRGFCLSMDGATEKIPFAKFAPRFKSTIVFYVLGHMFCMADMEDFTSVSFRSTPEDFVEITERYSAVVPPVNKAMKLWIRINLNEDMQDKEIYSYVKRAYEIVRDKYAKKIKK